MNRLVSVVPFVPVSQIVDACIGATHSNATPAETTWNTDTNGWTDTNGAGRLTNHNVVLEPIPSLQRRRTAVTTTKHDAATMTISGPVSWPVDSAIHAPTTVANTASPTDQPSI